MVRAQLDGQATTNSMLRTTTALTVINGGNKSNVLPARAVALVNFRILPGDTIEAVERPVHQAIADPPIALPRTGEARQPSPVSPPPRHGHLLLHRTLPDKLPRT